LWLGDVGIRVTNLEKSIDFYTKVFDLEEIDRGGDDEGTYVLFKDRHSGQRLELNWYAESNPFWAPYVVGESLDHFEVRVRSVPETMERLKRLGILPATRKLWVNRSAVAKRKEDPKFRKLMEEDVWVGRFRGTGVAGREAGGITQHIGATEVPLSAILEMCGDLVKGKSFRIPGLLFIDTPGHVAFSTLRARGGALADLAVLVIDVNE